MMDEWTERVARAIAKHEFHRYIYPAVAIGYAQFEDWFLDTLPIRSAQANIAIRETLLCLRDAPDEIFEIAPFTPADNKAIFRQTIDKLIKE